MNLDQYDALLFDMDGTLAVSKGPVTPSMAELLNQLLAKKTVAVISGGKFEQFTLQLISYLDPSVLTQLYILPTTGTALWKYDGATWQEVYNESLTEDERAHIISSLKQSLTEAKYNEPIVFGEIIEDRGSQITFSGLGSAASKEVKVSWDPDMQKRKKIISFLVPRLPNYSLTIGGMTSIDITKKGQDKAYGTKRFSEAASIPLSKILFVGDKLEPDGNDYPVRALGVEAVAVGSPEETETLIKEWLQ